MPNNKAFGQTIRSPIFLIVSFVVLFSIIYAFSSISIVYLYSSEIITREILKAPQQAHDKNVQVAANEILQVQETSSLKIVSSSNTVPNNVTEHAVIEELDEEDSETPDPLIPPAEVTVEERMKWFREKLPDLEVLRSTNLSREFHNRIVQFFENQCAIQFYMIWFSPARTFGPRDFLAVETLMKGNPQSCLVLISRSLDTRRGYKILKPLLDKGFKILAVTPDLPSLVKSTPAEAWLKEIKNGKIDPGKHPLSVNLSNLIRLAVLFKYGGVYLDTDFIILKDFKGLRNAVGAQAVDQVTHEWTTLNTAAMVFDHGHPLLFHFLHEFATTFDGSEWGHNGPYLITRVIKRVGNTPGYNLTILGMKVFYPIDWNQIYRYFRKPETEEELKWVEETAHELNNETYGLHLWNKITRNLVIDDGSVIDRLIKSHCLICRDTYNS